LSVNIVNLIIISCYTRYALLITVDFNPIGLLFDLELFQSNFYNYYGNILIMMDERQ
jgi:hypothetical protein